MPTVTPSRTPFTTTTGTTRGRASASGEVATTHPGHTPTCYAVAWGDQPHTCSHTCTHGQPKARHTAGWQCIKAKLRSHVLLITATHSETDARVAMPHVVTHIAMGFVGAIACVRS